MVFAASPASEAALAHIRHTEGGVRFWVRHVAWLRLASILDDRNRIALRESSDSHNPIILSARLRRYKWAGRRRYAILAASQNASNSAHQRHEWHRRKGY